MPDFPDNFPENDEDKLSSLSTVKLNYTFKIHNILGTFLIPISDPIFCIYLQIAVLHDVLLAESIIGYSCPISVQWPSIITKLSQQLIVVKTQIQPTTELN